MYLERAKVTNFRGIRRLSVDFESDSTFLIGENQWGKTSLLKVLWMLLGQGEELCQFDKSDLLLCPKGNLYTKKGKQRIVGRAFFGEIGLCRMNWRCLKWNI